VNGDIYKFVGLILQSAEAHNITIGGGIKYNIPSGNFTFETGPTPPQNRTSYALAAIVGADNFNDDNVTIRDVFDIIVDVTREVTPTCEFPTARSYLFVLLTRPESSRNHLVSWVRAIGGIYRGQILTTAPQLQFVWMACPFC
jgi:hypothetical protein